MRPWRTILLFIAPVLFSYYVHRKVFEFDVMGIHVWRQAQTETVIYNFAHRDNNILHPRKFDLTFGGDLLLYEFPVYQWLVAQVDRAIGYSVQNTRWFSFGLFVLMLAGFYRTVRRWLPEKESLMVNCLFCFSPLLHYYWITPMPDNLALAAAVWALYFLFRYKTSRRLPAAAVSFFLLAVAALAKLPYIVFGAAWVPLLYRHLRARMHARTAWLMLIACVLLAFPAWWYAKAIPTWGGNYIAQGILQNQKPAGRLFDILRGTLFELLPGLLLNPAGFILFGIGLVLVVRRFRKTVTTHPEWTAAAAGVLFYYLYEFSVIDLNHDYYLMPFVPLLVLLAGRGVVALTASRFRVLAYVLVLIAPLITWKTIGPRWNPQEPGFAIGLMHEQRQLQAAIPPDSLCMVHSDESRFIALYYLKRRGYTFVPGELNDSTFADRYQRGCRYLVVTEKQFDASQLWGWRLTHLAGEKVKVFWVERDQ